MFESLQKYHHCGQFKFRRFDNLKDVCNAPIDRSGVYLVWTKRSGGHYLLYIGRSGHKLKDGSIKHRQGGIKDRLVNGQQFGKIARRHSWPKVMEELGIYELDVQWYDSGMDDPVDVERDLLLEYQAAFGCLPPWNSKV